MAMYLFKNCDFFHEYVNMFNLLPRLSVCGDLTTICLCFNDDSEQGSFHSLLFALKMEDEHFEYEFSSYVKRVKSCM